MDRQMEEWLYYNFAAGSFHTKKLCSRLYWIEIKYYFKNKISLFEPSTGGLRGNVRTPSVACWKARGDFLFVIIDILLSLTVDTL